MSRIAIVFLLCLPLLLVAQNQSVQRELKNADIAIFNKEYSKALEFIETALEVSPYNIEALEKKINIYYSTDRAKVILKEVEELIKQNPSQPEYYYMRAILNLHRQKFTKSIEDFDAALEYNMPAENIYKIYLNKGVALFQYQEFVKAEESFQKAMDLEPKSAPIYHSWGMLKYETKEYDAAVDFFVKAIQLEETNPITYYNLGMTYFRLDDQDNACYYFNKSCSLGHRNACRLQLMECADEVNIRQ